MADGSLLKLFNSHLLEFLDDVISIFPNNLDLKTGKTFIEGIKKVNPKKLIEIWKYNIVDIYDDEMESRDVRMDAAYKIRALLDRYEFDAL